MKDKLDKIHAASMQILSEVGVRLHSDKVLALFSEAGQKVENDRVFPTEDFIKAQVKKAPTSFVLEARNPEYNMTLGEGQRHYAAGYGCSSVTEPDGTVRDALMADYINFAKIIHQSPIFKINGGILAQPSDVPVKLSNLAMIYAAILYSDKCLFIVPEHEKEIKRILSLAAAPWGGLGEFAKAPRSMVMISTLSPLQIDEMALSSIIASAELGQAMMISPGSMAGATGPVTLAGNMAMANAECLVGIAVSQLVKAGTAVMYGVQSTTSDLRSGSISIGSPGYALQAKYCKALADYYGLPCRCGGGVNDAKEVSAQSGYEAVLPLFTTAQNNVAMIVHSAGILDSFASISYEKFMCDLDIISMCEYFLNDMEVNDETLAVDVIKEIGPGGVFLTHKHTLENCRTTPWYPTVAQRGPLRGKRVADHLLTNAQNTRDKLLAAYKAPALAPEAVAAMDKIMVEAGADQAWLDSVKPKKL